MRKLSLILALFLLSSCQTTQPTQNEYGDFTKAPGWVSVFQTFTSDQETSINILRPHLADLQYVLDETTLDVEKVNWLPQQVIPVIKTTTGPMIHWKVDRLHLKNLSPQKNYRLLVVSKRSQKVIDWRTFKTLDIKNNKTRFIVGSCMSDSHAFEHVRDKIWPQMNQYNPDFLILLGDQVYVDDFDFVKREMATEFDLWTRYIDSLRKIPLFQQRNLIPLLAIWDDHDYGTNNSNKNFKSKEAALKVFTAFFGGEVIKDVIQTEKNGVYFSFNAYSQKFLLMDNRYYREATPDHPLGQWGEKQNQWFKKQIQTSKDPIWLANGGQFFTKATFVPLDAKNKKQINESYIDDFPTYFKKLIENIKTTKAPVVFLSGDVHYSEISLIEPEVVGYKTYEITSSPLHSYIYRSPDGKESWLENPRRMLAAKDHNFLLIESTSKNQTLDLKIQSLGIKSSSPLFHTNLKVQR